MNFSGLEDSSEVFLESFSLVSWELAKGLFHLRAQELKIQLRSRCYHYPDRGLDCVTFSQGWAASGAADYLQER